MTAHKDRPCYICKKQAQLSGKHFELVLCKIQYDAVTDGQNGKDKLTIRCTLSRNLFSKKKYVKSVNVN